MLDNGRITLRQLILLMIIIRQSQTLLAIPSIALGLKQDAWLGEVISIGLQIGMFSLFYLLHKRFPNLTLLGYCQVIFGTTLGKVCGLLICIYFLAIATFLTREMAGMLTDSVMPETPRYVLMVILIVATGYGVSKGLEVLARVTEILVPITIVVFALIMGIQLAKADLANLKPAFEASLGSTVRASITSASTFWFVVVMAQLLPKTKKAERATWLSVVLGQLFYGGMFVSGVVVAIGTLGPGLGETYLQPGYVVSKIFTVGTVVERIEALVLAFWLTGTYIKVAMFYYAAVTGLAELLGLELYKPLVTPVGILIVSLANLLFTDNVQQHLFYLNTWPRFSLLFEALLPIVLLIIAWLRKKSIGLGGVTHAGQR